MAVLAGRRWASPLSASRVAGSVGNAFRVRFADGTDVILKSAPRSFLDAEAWACRRMRAAGLPVPEVAAHSPEVPFLILRVLPGEPTKDREVWRQTGRAMRVAHRLPLPGYGRLAVDENGVRGRYDSWQDMLTGILDHVPALVTAGILTAGLADRARRVVRSSPVMKRRQPGVLLHQDLKPQHVFAVDGRLTGIIDWGDVGVGDPVWDIAGVSRAGQDVLNAFLDGYEPAATKPTSMKPKAMKTTAMKPQPWNRAVWNLQPWNLQLCNRWLWTPSGAPASRRRSELIASCATSRPCTSSARSAATGSTPTATASTATPRTAEHATPDRPTPDTADTRHREPLTRGTPNRGHPTPDTRTADTGTPRTADIRDAANRSHQGR